MRMSTLRSAIGRHLRIHNRIWDVVLALLLFGLSAGLRLPRLDAFVTADELKWVCRSTNFYRGLAAGDLELTRQTGHPGVITMWLGIPAMGIDPRSEALDPCGQPNYTAMVQASSPELPRFLGPLLFAARRSIALATSACVGIAFLLLARLLGRRVALLATLLLALDPFFLAHGRLLHLDAMTASLLYLSVLALALALREDRPLQWAAAGILGALAALNKSPGLFIGPFAAAALLVQTLNARRGLRWMVSRGLLWLGPFVASYVLFWPAMWVAPVETFRLVLETALAYAGNPHTNQNFFVGAPCLDPGPLFYPVALAFRLTPWSLLGFVAALPFLGSKARGREVMWTLGAFALGFGALMTLGQKKFDRYLLPVFPVVQTFAAIGLVGVSDLILGRWGQGLRRAWLRRLLPVALVLGLGVTVVVHAPYYLTYYNPLLGGARAATRTILVGWGEGLDVAARYLNALPGSGSARAAVRSQTDFAPFFRGETVDESYYDPATIDYVVIYLNEVQRQLDPELHARYFGVHEPLHVVRLKGIEYAWVYENATHEPPMEYVEGHADPETDAIVVSRFGRFQRFYDGPLRVHTIDPAWERERLLAALETAARGAERIWYVRYAERNPSALLDWIDYQWQTRAFSLGRQEFVDLDLFLYRTADGLSFIDTETTALDADLQFGDALVLERCILNGPSAQWRR
ncbi:MAG: glycosyltransferase family 39 protein, partial [Anaerolineae bacterium]|nr:glycosyltransferase family 39 protein [Anaerolineae bacterium]